MPDPASPPPDVEAVRRLLALRPPPELIAEKSRAVYEAVLRESPRVRTGNFTTIAPADLALLFDLYDAHFFAGQFKRLLDAGHAPLSFKLSRRLTRSAGTTTGFRERRPGGPAVRYE